MFKRWCGIVMLLAMCLTGCAPGNDPQPSQTEPPISTDGSRVTDPPVAQDMVSMEDIKPLSRVQEGKLFIQHKSDGRVLCIDRDGKILFRLEQGYLPDDLGGGGFCNGLALVSSEDDPARVCLCTQDGTIVTPERFGGEQFLFTHSAIRLQQARFFADGYIMVQGEDGLGLLDASLQWVVPMSMAYLDLNQTFAQEHDPDGWGAELYYDDGRLLAPDGYVDLVNGQLVDGLPGDLALEHPSDLWLEWRQGTSIKFQDPLGLSRPWALELDDWMNGTKKIPTLSFQDGYAGVLRSGEDGNTFGVIDEEGRYRSQPVWVVGTTFSYDRQTGMYCVDGIDDQGRSAIQIFTVDGLVYDHRYPLPQGAEHCSAQLQDGVIVLCIRYGADRAEGVEWVLLDLELQPLF